MVYLDLRFYRIWSDVYDEGNLIEQNTNGPCQSATPIGVILKAIESLRECVLACSWQFPEDE